MTLSSFAVVVLSTAALLYSAHAFTLPPSSQHRIPDAVTHSSLITQQFGWFDNLFPQLNDVEADEDRRRQFPEQYPATYEISTIRVASDTKEAAMLRPLLKQTQLEKRDLQLAYDASKHGWSAQAFHSKVDGKGAAIVLARYKKGMVGGYNPKGWASMGGARPSVAAFIFYDTSSGFQKLQKVGGGGLACGRDDPNFGICFGADALVIGLQPGRDERSASSKLGPYYERGPEERSSHSILLVMPYDWTV